MIPLRKTESASQCSAQSLAKNCRNGIAYTSEEDVIIREHILRAVLQEKKTITEGAKKAVEEIEVRLGRKRTLDAVVSRWYRWIKKRLPDSVKSEMSVVFRELTNMRIKKDLSAADIVDIADKHNRNPMHVLGVCGNLNGSQAIGVTVEQVLQLTREIDALRSQVAALKNLNRALLAQLISSNRYRAEAIKNGLIRVG